MTKIPFKPALAKLALTAGAASLAFAPVTASAGTRAGDNATVYSTSEAKPGQGRESKGESLGGGLSLVSLLIGAYFGAWTTLFISEITEDDEFQSPGV